MDLRKKIKNILRESGYSMSSGYYTGPTELGLKKWDKEELKPYTNFVDSKFNHDEKQKTLKNNIKRVVGVWEKDSNGSFDRDIYDVLTINEGENDFDWAQEDNIDVPLDEINSWCENNKDQISSWIKKIKEFNEKAPQMNWDENDDFYNNDKMSALSVKGIGDELINIFSSFQTISDEMNYLRNPDLYNED